MIFNCSISPNVCKEPVYLCLQLSTKYTNIVISVSHLNPLREDNIEDVTNFQNNLIYMHFPLHFSTLTMLVKQGLKSILTVVSKFTEDI